MGPDNYFYDLTFNDYLIEIYMDIIEALPNSPFIFIERCIIEPIAEFFNSIF